MAVSARWERQYPVSRNVTRGFLPLIAFSAFLFPLLWPGVLGIFRHLGAAWIAGYWGAADFELYLAFAIYLAFYTTRIQSTVPEASLGARP